MPFPAKTNSDAILASAADIIKTGSIASLSMRTLAGRLGVRASSLYRHFPDRSAIERALALRAAEQLLETMRTAVQTLKGERALFAAAGAYFDYATSETAFYDMMMTSMVALPGSSSAAEPLWQFFVHLVSEIPNSGGDLAGAAAVWGFLHGFTVVDKLGQLGKTSSKQVFVQGTQALVRGLLSANTEAIGTTP